MPWTSPHDKIRVTKLSIYVMPLSRTRCKNTKKTDTLCHVSSKKLIKILHNSRKNIKFATEKKKILG